MLVSKRWLKNNRIVVARKKRHAKKPAEAEATGDDSRPTGAGTGGAMVWRAMRREQQFVAEVDICDGSAMI
jgi:hypothetical protein